MNMLYIVYPKIKHMKKHILKNWNAKVSSIDFVDSHLNAGIKPHFTNGNEWILDPTYDFILPPSEQKEVRLERDRIVRSRAKKLLKYIRKIFYFATIPEKRDSIYFEKRDIKYRRQELMRHNTLNDKNKSALERLIYLEQVLLGVIDFSDETKSPVSLSKVTALSHLEFVDWVITERAIHGIKHSSAHNIIKNWCRKLF